MSITQTKFATQARTWVILSGLMALFIGLGYVFGGSAGLILFAGIAIVFNLVMFWYSDKLALKASKARSSRARRPSSTATSRRSPAAPACRCRCVYLIPSEQPNAFATGRSRRRPSSRSPRACSGTCRATR